MIAGVLLRALKDARRGGRRQAEDAEEWIASNVRDGVTCFLRVCEVLDIPPGRIRQAVRNGGANGRKVSMTWMPFSCEEDLNSYSYFREDVFAHEFRYNSGTSDVDRNGGVL